MEQEGVIKFELNFQTKELIVPQGKLSELNTCRNQLIEYRMLGQDPRRYSGLGFGNISIRKRNNESPFWITASQTGHLNTLQATDITLVERYDICSNTMSAIGTKHPSSESLSHAALYQSNCGINAVVHVHAPDIWERHRRLNLLTTDAKIPYGTPQLASTLESLSRSFNYLTEQVLGIALLGHEDGIVCAGPNLSTCTQFLLGLRKSLRSD